MNDNHTEIPAVVAHRPGRLRKLLVGMLLTAAAMLALVLGATPASAAGTAAPDVTVCFTFNGGPYVNSPLYLYRWNGSKWVQFNHGASNTRGCGTFKDVAPNSYYYGEAYVPYHDGTGYYAYAGFTNYGLIGNAYDGRYQLPTGSVTLRRLA